MEVYFKESIPHDIELILLRNGFDSKLALQSLNEDLIAEIEQQANKDRSILANTSYENVATFKFKPGHMIFLLNLSKQVILWSETDEKIFYDASSFSYMLQKFIQTAEANAGKHPKGHRYDKSIQSFATYIYLMCGKNCYETLSANLPIPQANTIRKFVWIFLFYSKRLVNKIELFQSAI